MKAITLYDLHRQIRRVIALNFDSPLSISAEIVKINSSRGHWYIELAEKDQSSNQIKAQTTGIIWKSQYQAIRSKYGELLDQVLQVGIEIAFRAEVQYHEVYGLKLHIQNIDPSYTLGQEGQRRLQIIEKLKKDKLLDKNNQRQLPGVIQNIAVISSQSAAGYSDFIESLQSAQSNIAYRTYLYPASMQGDKTETEVRKQLETIQKEPATFDLIVIIRGGGGRMDLRYFDSFNIAKDIADSPLPVWVGIGHAVDQSVLDMVAHTSCKTPTAVAQHIEEHNRNFIDELERSKLRIKELVQYRISMCRNENQQLNQQLSYLLKGAIDKKYNQVQNSREKLLELTNRKIELMQVEIQQVRQRLQDLQPQRILERGYVAIEQNELRISRKEDLELNKEFAITFANGVQTITPKK